MRSVGAVIVQRRRRGLRRTARPRILGPRGCRRLLRPAGLTLALMVLAAAILAAVIRFAPLMFGLPSGSLRRLAGYLLHERNGLPDQFLDRCHRLCII